MVNGILGFRRPTKWAVTAAWLSVANRESIHNLQINKKII
jgi:hypothetical protein